MVNDIITVVIREPVPKPGTFVRSNFLPFGSGSARDSCGDGTEEFRHINPLVVWKNLPVRYFIEDSVPSGLIDAIIASFEVWNATMGGSLYQRTMSSSDAKITVNVLPIDEQGGTLAQAQWSYSQSRGEMTRAEITFDSRERWAVLSNESCGSNGGIFDIMNVAVHEIGHVSGLDHAPTDRLQTMYASTGPGVTLGRTPGNGDIKGFKQAYQVITPPPPPPPPPPPVTVTRPKIITISGTNYLNVAYENVSGVFLNIKNLPFGGVHARIITESGKQYVYTYYYRAANLFTTLGRIPLQ